MAQGCSEYAPPSSLKRSPEIDVTRPSASNSNNSDTAVPAGRGATAAARSSRAVHVTAAEGSNAVGIQTASPRNLCTAPAFNGGVTVWWTIGYTPSADAV